MDSIQSTLSSFSISSEWGPFDHQSIINHLKQPGGSVAIAGDPYFIRDAITSHGYPSHIPYSYGGALHVIALTDIQVNQFNQVAAYIGLDANTDKPLLFSPEQIEKMVKNSSKLGRYLGWILLAAPR